MLDNDRFERDGSELLLAIGANDDEPPLDELLPRAVIGVPLDTLLRKAVTIAASLANAEDLGRDDAAFWHDVAASLDDRALPQELLDAIDGGVRITSTTQLANLGLFAVRHRNLVELARPTSFLRLLGMYNFVELRDPSTNKYYIDPESIQAAFAVTTSHRERFLNVADRYLAFVEWSDAGLSAKARGEVRSLVEFTAGMSFENYLRCVAALLRYFDPPDARLNGLRPLSRYAVRHDALAAWLDEHSWTPEDVDRALGDKPLETLRDRGHFLVLERPFVRIADEYYLLNPRGLDNALGLGIFYAAMDAKVARADNNALARQAAAKEFGGLAGQYYEQYAGNQLRRIAERSGSYFHGEVCDREGRRSCDFFVVEGDSLIVFEMRHGQVARPVVEGLDSQRIETAFHDVLYAKVEQLQRSVDGIADKQIVIPGVELERVRKIYPVVCLSSAFPRSVAVQRKIDRDLLEAGWLQGAAGFEIAPLEIIEAESLEGLAGLDDPVVLSALIDEKTSNPRTRWAYFKNFLVSVKGLQLRMNREDQHRRAGVLRDLENEAADWVAW